MVKKIKIYGFKSILDMEIELGKVNCFIGANGAGKSNILEAIGVLGAAANGVVDDESLLRRGVRPGLPRLYKSSFEATRTPVHITLDALGADGEEYRISILNPLGNPNPAWEYKTEYLFDGKNTIVSDGIRNKQNLTPTAGLAALKLVEIGSSNPASKLMNRLQSYSIYSPNTPTLRGTISDAQSREPLGLSGGRLAEAFYEFRKTMLNTDQELNDGLLSLIDWASEIETTNSGGLLLSPSVARTKNVLKFTDRFMKNSRNTLTAYDASEGSLYILFSAILALSHNAPKLLAIDNLDQSLNPRLVARLVDALCGWVERYGHGRQMLFTSHNPAVLDGMDLMNNDVRLFAVQRNSDGHTKITRILMTEKMLELNSKYPLSRLWLMGHLGAVPNV